MFACHRIAPSLKSLSVGGHDASVQERRISMPPKSRITRQMILDASIDVVHRLGINALNVRAVASQLKCSTQPVMYHFATMEELKNEIYTIVDQRHTGFIMDVDFENDPNPAVAICKKYIQFAVEEPHLFRFLFQTDKFANTNLIDMIQSEQLAPIFQAMSEMVQLTPEQARDAFASTFFAVHGFASLLANNSMVYEEEYCNRLIETIFCGSIGFMKVGWEESLYPNGEGRPDAPPPWERNS